MAVMGPYWRNIGVYEDGKYNYWNELQQTGIREAYKNDRTTLVGLTAFVATKSLLVFICWCVTASLRVILYWNAPIITLYDVWLSSYNALKCKCSEHGHQSV